MRITVSITFHNPILPAFLPIATAMLSQNSLQLYHIYILYIIYIYYIYYIYISSENFINPKFDGFETDQMTDQWSLLATRTNISRQLPDVDF